MEVFQSVLHDPKLNLEEKFETVFTIFVKSVSFHSAEEYKQKFPAEYHLAKGMFYSGCAARDNEKSA